MSEGPGPSRRATILWPLTLVAAAHLLTTPGQWLLTDHAEYIVVADRLVGRGSLHVSEPGEAPPRELPWLAPARPGEPLRSRLLPLTSVALAPFVLADRALVGAMVLVFATFPQPEPTRRMAAAWPAWGMAAGRMPSHLRLRLAARQAVLALAAVVGFNGFWNAEGRYHAGPGGLFYPSVVWVRLWIASAPAWQFALPCAALVVALVIAAARTSRLLALDEPAHG